ncbi:riboflavin kinase [Neocloeon triangulifer]|uniref:riboflavin kinase n=1 Tax=Neocloeon triangulifer TaxID=2078957 RepID=UPI00286F6469|nr:riboflavin kinase [Neocloeon triangulifer]
MLLKGLPHFAVGEVIKGFQRGSKELGIPTANFPHEVVENLPTGVETGIYYGWASVDDGPVYKMVMSVGWNPYYKNEKKSMETHIMHKFDDDFYGSTLKVCMVGYLRPEMDFKSLDELIEAINQDIKNASEALDQPSKLKYKDHEFFLPHKNGLINKESQQKSL